MEIVKGAKSKIVVQKQQLESYLGKPAFAADEMFENIPGVVTGLAWTSMGGATLQIEATAVFSKNKGFKQTGQLGAVMVESADIAYSYIMAQLKNYGVKPDFFDERFVHIHVPAGATPKDGPSAGITMATALLSMILQKPVRKRLAMTGELTLTGQVLPIGGLKEKVIAARRVGCKRLIFPEANRKDFEELPDYLKRGFEVHFAARFEDVYKAAFFDHTAKQAAS
jgi:ATP-dependent Lon protease